MRRIGNMKVCKTAGVALCLLCVPMIQGCIGALTPGAVGAVGAGGAVASRDRRTPGAFIDDELIELKVGSAIAGDVLLSDQTHINATSFNGIVLLTGEAPGESLRTRITEIVRGIDKVRGVQNEIALLAPSTLLARAADALVTGKVKAALFRDKEISAGRVKVVTERGVVYLMGLLRQEEVDRAAEIARRVGGVQRVVKVVDYVE